MGTDIHGGFIKVVRNTENKVVSKQAVHAEWSMDRDYTLFAILAGVRNGVGFAGCYRHEPLTPIAEGRGKPDFITLKEECSEDLYNKWYGSDYGGEDETEYGEWLGDHSFTHMTVKEILDWSGWDKHVQRGGILTVEHYFETISKGIEPSSWCGGVSGVSVNIAEGVAELLAANIVMDNSKYSHIRCTWSDGDSLRELYKWFLDEVQRISDEFGEDTYLVIGFDS